MTKPGDKFVYPMLTHSCTSVSTVQLEHQSGLSLGKMQFTAF